MRHISRLSAGVLQLLPELADHQDLPTWLVGRLRDSQGDQRDGGHLDTNHTAGCILEAERHDDGQDGRHSTACGIDCLMFMMVAARFRG